MMAIVLLYVLRVSVCRVDDELSRVIVQDDDGDGEVRGFYFYFSVGCGNYTERTSRGCVCTTNRDLGFLHRDNAKC